MEIANETLSSSEVIKLFETIEKGIADSLSDDIISKDSKERIRSNVVTAGAGAIIREVGVTLICLIYFTTAT